MGIQKKSKLNDSEKEVLREKYAFEGISKRQSKKRMKFLLNNMVAPNVQV